MPKLVVYGSLMNESELQDQGLWGHDIEPIKVFGYRRVFNQEPSYRLVDSNARAVLSVQKKEDAWFNAILIKDLDEAYFEALDMREIGYERIKTDVKTYKGEFYKECFVYIGRSEKRNNEIIPNEAYLDICSQGAQSYGEEFYQDFLQTTFKNSATGIVLI